MIQKSLSGDVIMNKKNIKTAAEESDLKSDIEGFLIDISIQESIKKFIEQVDKRYKNEGGSGNGIKTGLGKLTLKEGELNILTSKSDFLTNAFELSLIYHISIQGKEKSGLFIPGNYNNVEIVTRLVSMISEISVGKISSGFLKKEEIKKIENACNELYKAPINIFNEPNISIEKLESIITHYVQAYHIKIAFIEGFKFIEELVDSKEKDYRDNLYLILDTFKRLSEKLNITIIVGMVLSKKENEENNCFPTINDFKKYLIIPNMADRIFFIHIDSYMFGQDTQKATLNVTERLGIKSPYYDLKFITNIGLFINDETVSTN